MSIENTLESIAASLHKIADFLTSPQAAAPTQAPVPVPQASAPSAQVVPMPGLPPQAPVPAPVPQAQPQAYPASPLNTPDDVQAYCAHKFKTGGPNKGAEMQAVLTGLGHANLNTLRPDQYAEFYAKIEAIA